ncbi:MAG: DUF2231 domain-containing protein [Fidelibacterota bacterium]
MFPWTPQTVHPLFVHFPIALFSTSWLCDVLGVRFKKESLHQAGWWCLTFGVLSAVFTVGTGFLADTVTGHMSDPFPLYSTHGVVQLTASAVFLFLFVWRWRLGVRLPDRPGLYVYLGLGAVATALIFYGGHLGAQLAGRI